MHFPTCSSHEVRVVEKCGQGAVLFTKVNEVRQDSQDGSVPSDIVTLKKLHMLHVAVPPVCSALFGALL
jgi:hypothetical protein